MSLHRQLYCVYWTTRFLHRLLYHLLSWWIQWVVGEIWKTRELRNTNLRYKQVQSKTWIVWGLVGVYSTLYAIARVRWCLVNSIDMTQLQIISTLLISNQQLTPLFLCLHRSYICHPPAHPLSPRYFPCPPTGSVYLLWDWCLPCLASGCVQETRISVDRILVDVYRLWIYSPSFLVHRKVAWG